MRNFANIRDPNPEASGAGGASTGANAPETSAAPAGPSETVKNVWGGRDAPDWVKAVGVSEAHSKSNEAAGTPTKTEPDPSAAPTQPEGGQPATQPGTTAPAATQPTAQPPVQPAAPAGVDSAALAKAITDGLKGAMPQQPGQPQPTEAQQQAALEQQLAVYKMTEADYEEAFGVKPSPQQLAAQNRVLQAVAKQGATVAYVLAQKMFNDHQATMQPYMAAVRQAEAQRQVATFYTENADLKGYEALVEKEYKLALASGQKFPTPEAARKFVADQTRAALKLVGITPRAPAAGTGPSANPTAAAPQPQSRQMTTTSVGGRGGGSAAAGNGKPANKIEAVWGTAKR